MAVILLTVYFVIMVLRLMQLPRPSSLAGFDAQAPAIRTPPPEFDAPPGSVLAGVWPQPVEPSIGELSSDYLSPQPEGGSGEFSQQLAQASVSAEMRQMHMELAHARNEITRLRGEMAQLQAAQHVSPLYGEAMSLAVRGADAAGVAARCGISIAEAELVVALSRAPGNKKTSAADEEYHGRI